MSDIIIPATITVDENYLRPKVWDTTDNVAELVTGLPLRSGALVNGATDYDPKQIFKINVGQILEGDDFEVFSYCQVTNDLNYLVSVPANLIISSDSNDAGQPGNDAIDISEVKGDNVSKTVQHHHVIIENGWRKITAADISKLGTGDCYVILTAYAVSTAWQSGDNIQVNQDYGQMRVKRTRLASSGSSPLTKASQAEAEAGVEDTHYMTALKTAQAIAALAPSGELPSGVPIILKQSGAAIVNPNNTNENILATVTVPAGAMGLNGAIRIRSTWSTTNSANNKTKRIRFGGINGVAFFNRTHSTFASDKGFTDIVNRNSASLQMGQDPAVSGSGATGTPNITSAVNTANAVDIVFTAQNANAGDTTTLESYTVELLVP